MGVEKLKCLGWKTGELVWLGILTLIDWIKWALDISLLSKHRSSSYLRLMWQPSPVITDVCQLTATPMFG